jgi:hypothetical protein
MRPSLILPWLTVLTLSGCYAELWGGVYPITRGERTYEGESTATDGPLSYSVGVAVGVWFDHFGVGVGYAPHDLAPEAVVSWVDDEKGQATVRADQLRVDVDLPSKWGNPWFFPRATLVYGGVSAVDRCVSGDSPCTNRVSYDTTGKNVYLGLTATLFTRNFSVSAGPAYLSYRHGATPEPGRMPERDFQAFGAQVRLQVVFRMGLEFFQFYTPSLIRPIPAGLSHKCRPFATEKDCYP